MKNLLALFLLPAFFLLSLITLSAQGCDGVVGPDIFAEDFASGAGPGPALPPGTTTYNYGSIGGGNYVVTNTTGLNGNLWHVSEDHTPDDVNGYCLLFDASATPGKFYSRQFDDLCENTQYTFSCYAANIVRPTACGGNSIEPNLKFSLIDPVTMAEIASVNTGGIPTTSNMTWNQYSISFQTNPGQPNILIEITNNASGGCGNDLVIDDFSFNICNPTREQEFSLCALPNGEIQVGTETYDTPGAYETMIDVPNTCNDSIIYTTLTDNSITNNTFQNLSFCQGGSIAIEGIVYTSAQTVLDTVSINECVAETVTYIIAEIPASVSNESVSFCEGDSIFLTDRWIFEAGVYQDTIATNLGCDTVVSYNVSVLSFTSTEEVVICEGDSVFLGGNWLSEVGVFQDTLTAVSGCDSIVSYNVITLNFVNEENIFICEGDSIFLADSWLSEVGIYQDTLFSVLGCDSIVNYNLNTSAFANEEDVFICPGDSLFIAGTWLTEAGIYLDTFASVLGCDSIVSYNLTVSTFAISLNTESVTLEPQETIQLFASSNSVGEIIYEWFPPGLFSCADCPDPLFSPTQSGAYELTGIDSITGCSDNVQFNVVIEPCKESYFPNAFSPNYDGVNDYYAPFLSDCIVEVVSFRVFDRWGGVVHSQRNILPGMTRWNGSTHSKPAANGVYIYVLEALRFDGEQEVFKGDIVLL